VSLTRSFSLILFLLALSLMPLVPTVASPPDDNALASASPASRGPDWEVIDVLVSFLSL
jgi:hypothetical protein